MRTNRQGLKLVSHDGRLSGPAQEQANPITENDYLILTAWRDTLRGFMTASKAILKQANVTPNQYQALLAIRFGSEREQLTVGELARNLHIRHNSAVTLINKLVERGAVRRVASHKDRRVVYLHLTTRGETALRKLVTAHRRELDATAPVLRKILP
jgi:DNA-binding MarR family transcriptional regulator